MNIIRETKLQGIINDFKLFKKQFANVTPVSHEHWILLKSEPNYTHLEKEDTIPTYKVPISGVCEAVLNHEMYQQLHNLTYNQQPYSYVFFGKRLLFLIRYDGGVYNSAGNEIDIKAVQDFTSNLTKSQLN